LQAFHLQCYGTDLSDANLARLVDDHRSQVILDHAPLPVTIDTNPATPIPDTLIPDSLSASDYQSLINCPYQFFAARCLKLAAPEVVKEALQKADYGQRVHRCLEAFHQDVEGLPGPLGKTITDSNKQEALELLNQISLAVFSSDIEDNFMHRGWLKRWLKIVPLYIDWEIEQQKHSSPAGHEISIKDAVLSENVSIKGRIDRIDRQENGIAILDYKTGQSPREADIISGEAIQLPFYLLLLGADNQSSFSKYCTSEGDQVSAFYVDLNEGKKDLTKSKLENSELLSAVNRNRDRLITVIDQLHQGHQAPAWGSVEVCKYCDMDVVCRKQSWSDSKQN